MRLGLFLSLAMLMLSAAGWSQPRQIPTYPPSTAVSTEQEQKNTVVEKIGPVHIANFCSEEAIVAGYIVCKIQLGAVVAYPWKDPMPDPTAKSGMVVTVDERGIAHALNLVNRLADVANTGQAVEISLSGLPRATGVEALTKKIQGVAPLGKDSH